MYTETIIHWINSQDYSKNHWNTIANEIREKEPDRQKAIQQLAKAIESFHHTYKDAVVKEGNVLHDLLNQCFERVNWITVSETYYS